MPTASFHFPAGRFHATPWGHHVNEGLIEWPPCPWRLLRALLATGFTHHGWTEVPPVAERLIGRLASALPSYCLPTAPAASAAHSRHFMPVGRIDGGREQTTLVFDTWAHVGDGALTVSWPCTLEEDEAALFTDLVASLGYLGRSESWVVGEIVPEEKIPESQFNVRPCQEEMGPTPGWDQISLVAAMPSEEYAAWRERAIEHVLAAFPLPEGKRKPPAKLLKEREKAVAPFPDNLAHCLTRDTAWWKGHGWSHPPGSRRVLYLRKQEAAITVAAPPRPRRKSPETVTTMVLALTTVSGNRSALPPVKRTLPQAELIHQAIISRLGQGERVNCPELTGQDGDGERLRDRHQHAYTIPIDLDGDGRLDHIIIHATMGLGDLAQRAIRSLRKTYAKGVDDIQVAVVGSGEVEMLRRLPRPFDQVIKHLLGPPGGSRVWESVTPFVPPRYLKPRGRNDLAGQVNAELASRGFPETEHCVLDPGLTKAVRHDVRRRAHGGVPPVQDVGVGLRLTFPEPVSGPLLIGYASHYGLGRFRAVHG